MTMVDWGAGSYEETARRLEPAARVVVERAAPAPGERVVDVGCGTGNAALLAAERGATVTGVDPAARLLDVAQHEAAARNLDIAFAPGDAAALPLADAETDVMLSMFELIFAPDPQAAAAELARVTKPGGRIVFSAWIPEGTISQAVRAAGEAVRNALDQPPPSAPPFPWHHLDALTELFAPHGFEVTVDEHQLAFTAASAQDYLDEQERHPAALAGQAVLGPRGESDALRERLLAIYEAGNEEPDGFRVTSSYVVVTARIPPKRPGGT